MVLRLALHQDQQVTLSSTAMQLTLSGNVKVHDPSCKSSASDGFFATTTVVFMHIGLVIPVQ